ncbi:nuclease-related domain-containing protein [Hutsoniella sourekii]|uniref:nuclease-related domain-containing protein n=1 Tax=Hutsoniella sourekii TaxID=87650 RepID=UPI00047FF760|nr:nuclease-related domain-containing protein [Hutsoniella sourekii]
MKNIALQVWEAKARRRLISEWEVADYQKTKRGFIGELTMAGLLQEFGLKHYQLVHDLALDFQGKFQVDFLLVFDDVIYLLEVKNYLGRFDYVAGKTCQLRGKSMSEDIISGLARRSHKFHQLLKELNLGHFRVEPVLIFVNNYCQIGELDHPHENLQVIARAWIPNWIYQLKTRHHGRIQTEDYRYLLSGLDLYRDPTNYLPDPVSNLSHSTSRLGLFCSKCRQYLPKVGKIYTECGECGTRHHKGKLLDLACSDLALLCHDDPKILTCPQLQVIVGSTISRQFIRAHLNTHYQAHSRFRHRYYTFLPDQDPARNFSPADLAILEKYW